MQCDVGPLINRVSDSRDSMGLKTHVRVNKRRRMLQ